MLINHDDEIAKDVHIVDSEDNIYDYVKSFDTETKVGEVYVILKGKHSRVAVEQDGKTPATHKIKFPDSTIAVNKITGEEIK